MNSILLECKNIYKIYKERKILSNLSFKIFKKDMVSIIGRSGSGKSTLLHLLGGLDNPTSGDIIFNKEKINTFSNTQKAKFRNKKLGFIYQFHHLLSDFNILENVAIPLLIGKIEKRKAKKRACEILKKIGLDKKIYSFPSQLSGGEKQRVAIARALINNPELILADEPTGNLDNYNTKLIFNLMNLINQKKGTTFLVVTHNLFLAKKLKKQIYLQDGKINFKNFKK